MSYKPIVLSKPEKISLPKQNITRKRWLNDFDNFWISLLGKYLLGIRDDLEITEYNYDSPIRTGFPENNIGRVRHYKASDDKAVIVLPNRGIGFNPAVLVSAYLASHGISVYEVETPLHESRLPSGIRSIVQLEINFDNLRTYFNQAITETRAVLDHVEESSVGIMGISLGAFYANNLYSIDDRLNSACLVFAGGDLAGMISVSDDRLLRHMKEHIKRYDFDHDFVVSELASVEPINFTDPGKAENLLMINASSDKSIPVEYAEKLRQAWGNPRQLYKNGGHFSLVLRVLSCLPEIRKHYEQTLYQL